MNGIRTTLTVALCVTTLATSVKSSAANGVFSAVKYQKLISVLKRSHGEMDPLGAKGESIPLAEQTTRIEEVCGSDFAKIEAREIIDQTGKMWSFICRTTSETPADAPVNAGPASEAQQKTLQVVATVDTDETKLLDLQVFDIASRELPRRQLAHEITKIAFTVTVATLAAGLLAAGIYPHQKDKLKHAFYGSLMASLVTVSSYYGLNLSPAQSMWVGIAGTVIFSLLKEYAYDRHHRDIHTVDFQDAVATSMGGATAAVGLRYTLSW